MRLRDIPSLCAVLVVGIIGAAVARVTGTDAEDDLDDSLGEE